jgi:hypothetical protein
MANKVLCLGLLEVAKVVVLQYQHSPLVVPMAQTRPDMLAALRAHKNGGQQP